MTKTCVIIGGGLGGLFTGALLAKEGYRVQVLEKNRIIGGGLQCFMRHGQIFETGMHILGGFHEGGSLHKLCTYLGIMDKLHIRPTDEDIIDSISYLSDGKTYRIPRGKAAFKAYLSAEFPGERDGIAAYTDALYRLADEVDLFYLRKPSRHLFLHSDEFLASASGLIETYVKDPKLRDLLAYMNPLYCGEAGRTPAYIHALINVLYIEGSSQFEGGSQQMADLLADVICRSGGEVLANDAVAAIHVEDKTVQWVETRSGRRFSADWYISAIHPCAMLDIITPSAFPKAYRDRLRAVPNAYSSFTVYIRFKENTFPYINHPCYCQKDYGMAWDYGCYDADTWPAGFMCITPPEAIQGHYASSMVVFCVMDYEEVREWEHTAVGRRGDDYEKWKQRHIEKIMDVLERFYPGIKETVAEILAASPLTIRDYYGTKDGTLYGFRKDCRNMALSQLSIRTKVSNLLLTGQNVNLHGICGVPLTAVETVETIVGFGMVIDQVNACYESRKQQVGRTDG